MKKRNFAGLLIALAVIAISLLHFFANHENSPIHNFYRLLYFIPIIYAAFRFGFKGGVLTSLAVNLIYSPFILLTFKSLNEQPINDVLDVVLFFAVGIITGILVEKKNASMTQLDHELKRYKILENYTNSIIESIKNGVIAVNSDMLVTMINSGAKSMLRVNDDSVGASFLDAFSCCEGIKESLIHSIESNVPEENIEVKINRENRVLNLRVNIYPLNYENGGSVIILEDVTQINRLQNEFMRKEKLVALGELSSGVAHEIRNPLAIIKAIGQTMKSELAGNEEAVKELEIIEEEVERANKVVKALMELGRPNTGIKAMFPIDKVIDDVIMVTKPYITQHGVKVEISRENDSLAYIDKELLKQAFINIVFNAVQSMPAGGILKIGVCNVNGGYVKVFIKDSGIGIPKENMNKIFNPFFTTKDEGTGLGLPMVQKIIEEHGGTINVTSEVGFGTTFEIMIPAGRDDLP